MSDNRTDIEKNPTVLYTLQMVFLLGPGRCLFRSDVARLNVADRVDIPPPFVLAATLIKKIKEILEDFVKRHTRLVGGRKCPLDGRLGKPVFLEREVSS